MTGAALPIEWDRLIVTERLRIVCLAGPGPVCYLNAVSSCPGPHDPLFVYSVDGPYGMLLNTSIRITPEMLDDGGPDVLSYVQTRALRKLAPGNLWRAQEVAML